MQKLEDLEEYLNGWENPLREMIKNLKKTQELNDVLFYKKILYPPKRRLRILQIDKYSECDDDYRFHIS